MLTSLLPPEVCASCRLCCNFLPESLWERPALEEECAAHLRSLQVPLEQRPEGGETIALKADSEQQEKAADCPLLDRSCGCRIPRALRPLECRLWPIRLMRDEAGHVLVTCYNACPGLASVSHEKLSNFARALTPLLQERAARYPASIRPLHPKYTILFTLNESPIC